MPAAAPQPPRTRSVGDGVDRVVTLLRRSVAFWRRALVVFVVAGAIGLAIAALAPRLFRSETLVLYQETMRGSDLTSGGEGAENARRVGARLREVLLSRTSLESVIRELNLFPKLKDKDDLIDAVDDMRKGISFKAREGDTFYIAFDAPSPTEAQEVTKRLANLIVQEAAKRRSENAEALRDFLNAESNHNKVELHSKEANLAEFVAKHPDFAGPTLGEVHSATPAATRAPATGDATTAALEWKALRIERQLRAGNDAPPPQPPAKPIAASPIPDSLELIAARKAFEEKSARFTDKHPDVIEARGRLQAAEAEQANAQSAADAKAAQTTAGAAADLYPSKPATDEERAALKKELSELRALIAARKTGTVSPAGPSEPTTEGSVALEVEFRRLQREVNEARERQRQLDDRQFKASVAASSVMDERNVQVSVLDPAYLPAHPVTKPRRILFGGALLAALVLALAAAIVSAGLDNRVYDRSDLEALTVPIIGFIPPPPVLPRRSA